MSSGDRQLPTRSSSAIDVGRISRLAKKELREILRDRRTIITLVLMPLLVYPLLGIVVQKFVVSTATTQSSSEIKHVILCDNEETLQGFFAALKRGDRMLSEARPDFDNTAFNPLIQRPPKAEADVTEYVRNGEADCAVTMTEGAFKITYRKESVLSTQAFEQVILRLEALNDGTLTRALAESGLRFEPPVKYSADILETSEPVSLAAFIPLMLVLMTITGAVYPAIDLTAGERERGTMEILIAAPVPRLTLLLAKFVAVLSVAMLTAIVNLTAMLITSYALGMETLIFGDAGVSPLVIAQIFLLLLVFAAFFSAVLLGITSFARSFKEAQAYLIPVMLVALAPGLVSIMPEIEFSMQLAIVPLVNIVLLGRDLLLGNFNPTLASITLISTTIYGVLALSLAARVFGGDAILYSSAGTWSDMFRRPTEKLAEPTLAGAMLALAILFPSFIILGALPAKMTAQFDPSDLPKLAESAELRNAISLQLLMNIGITVLLFLVLPITLAYVMHLSKRNTFSLRGTSPLWFVAAIMLGCSVWPFIYELNLVLLSEMRLESFQELYDSLKITLKACPFPLKLAALAIAPAICEEVFFRGFLLSALRKHSTGAFGSTANSFLQKHANDVAAVVLSSLLFGLFHVIVRDVLLIERIVPTTIMGIILALICIRSGSIFPGMLLHLLHNGLMVSLATYHTELAEMGWGVEEQKHLPQLWLIVAAVPAAFGLILAFVLRRRPPETKKFGEAS